MIQAKTVCFRYNLHTSAPSRDYFKSEHILLHHIYLIVYQYKTLWLQYQPTSVADSCWLERIGVVFEALYIIKTDMNAPEKKKMSAYCTFFDQMGAAQQSTNTPMTCYYHHIKLLPCGGNVSEHMCPFTHPPHTKQHRCSFRVTSRMYRKTKTMS